MKNHATRPVIAPTPAIPPITPPAIAPTVELFEVGVEDAVLVVETGTLVDSDVVEVGMLMDSGAVALDSGRSPSSCAAVALKISLVTTSR